MSSDQVLDCDESVVFDAASRWLLAPSESPPRQRHAPEVRFKYSFGCLQSIRLVRITVEGGTVEGGNMGDFDGIPERMVYDTMTWRMSSTMMYRP